ncbi:ATPase [Methylocystis sp. MJC1]|uniref:F0F1 ATP synthase subunit B family protein n=1 Tax=Methylocystis sp. MJC1 TaxID=2654282 RepID=UPI0013ED4BF3|nr:ATPase [Methylocystis sp. MJC1]KAF2991048.1 ATP synthase subunit b' [Methylocystis sp. MJC1]MBU6526032.1 ATPase [Methylocystis sp. MJC1]UZX12498.1 ATPase [Methylocystis sp. MJC1]
MAIISSAHAAEAEQETQATHESVGASGGEAHHEGGFPPFQTENFAPQLFWLVLIFGFLYILMSRIALPRVGGIIENREQKIASDLDASREMQAKAQAAAAANDENLRLRREEAQAIGREAQQKIANETAAQRARAESEAGEKIRAAEERINVAKSAALANVEEIALDAAASIVEKLTGVPADRARLAAEYKSVN